MLAAVNAGRFAEVPGRLKLWVKAGGRVLPGLEKRRAAEAALFMSDVEARPPARAGIMDVLVALWRFLTATREKQ